MHSKRFTAPDMRRALRRVRDELGADAVILSHRKVSGGVELEAVSELPSVAGDATRPTSPPAVGAETPLQWSGPEQNEGEWGRMQDELRNMRALLEQQLSASAWSRLQQERPGQAGMWKRLNRMGLDTDVCRLLLARYDEAQSAEQAWQGLMRDLSDMLPVTAPDPVAAGGVFALVGPAGAGKTSCVAKLATRHALAHGSEGLALVTLDRFRIGAQEQLRVLSRVLNVPLLVTRDEAELGDLLYRLRHHRLVLVDTAGFSRRDPQLGQQLAAIDALGERLQVLQVLAATSQYPVLKADQHSYRCEQVAGLILTKLDETASLGEPMSLMIRRGLPLAYTSSGQNIPNDLESADSRELVAAAIALGRQRELDEQSLARAVADAGIASVR